MSIHSSEDNNSSNGSNAMSLDQDEHDIDAEEKEKENVSIDTDKDKDKVIHRYGVESLSDIIIKVTSHPHIEYHVHSQILAMWSHS
jgi:hypothetical protein